MHNNSRPQVAGVQNNSIGFGGKDCEYKNWNYEQHKYDTEILTI